MRSHRASLSVALLCAASQASANDFQSVRSILARHCVACHGGVKQAGGLSFVDREGAMAEADSGMQVIVPGDPDGSELFLRATSDDEFIRMPPPDHGPPLAEHEIAQIRHWIEAGARWERPWAYQPPTNVDPPASDWSRSSMDSYVKAWLQEEGLSPSAEAKGDHWLRRVSFDLTGLPPTAKDRNDFDADSSPDAYERVVDQLLDSSHFGERWAAVWLDLARYGDTMGYEKDPPRTIWPWRDWVVRALNNDMPYNQFLLKQFAGDLLAEVTIDDRLATALHRNSPTNTEGGTDDEEFRWSAVVDRVDTTAAAILGLTLGCARCHDHPYESITQEDYYRFAALLNTTADADLQEEWPKLAIPKDREQHEQAASLDRQIAQIDREIHQIGLQVNAAAGDWAPLPIDSAESTGQTELVISDQEVRTKGTVTDRSSFTLMAPLPNEPIAALRIDTTPLDPELAKKVPESGFVLSQLRVEIEQTTGEEPLDQPFFIEAFADRQGDFFEVTESIRDTPRGWGPYTRVRTPRWALFVFDKPIEPRDGARLKIHLKHNMATDGQGPLVMRRFRISMSDAEALTASAVDPKLRELREDAAELHAARKAIASTTTPVLAELPADASRATYLFERGNWLAPTEAVSPGIPSALAGEASDRLELGRWLGAAENPLTARVFVNRVWAEVFGAGLVEPMDDLGSATPEPWRGALLDHLALKFQFEFRWSIKALLREIVLSATYRQDARATDELVRRDPTNRLLARGARIRLTAEMVRDQALMLAGRLNRKVGGPPVMPYQPEGVWQSVYNNQRWEISEGDDRYRRAIYTYWKRTAPYPSMTAFDAPSREQCAVNRPTSNTPLQALVTLNDPAYVELAECFAERIADHSPDNVPNSIRWAFREATGLEPTPDCIEPLIELYEQALESGDEQFALTITAGAILNLDATLNR